MPQEQWGAVDQYFGDLLITPDPVLEAALQANAENSLPAMDVSPLQGKLLMLLAQIHGARTILEIGTLGGYSTIWLGRALPAGGRLVTLEADPKHAEVARANIARAALTETVELRLGLALAKLLLKWGCDPLPCVTTKTWASYLLRCAKAASADMMSAFSKRLSVSRPLRRRASRLKK